MGCLSKGRLKMTKSLRTNVLLFLGGYILVVHGIAHGFDFKSNGEKKVVMTNVAGIAVITGWGIFNWDYFTRSPEFENEGWFEKDTKEGGADKLGHFYINYTLSHFLSNQYEAWGYLRKKAGLMGALSAFTMMGWMEMGDAFSNYGFSHEDFLMNTLGSVAGYVTHVYPDISRKIDFRVEYLPDDFGEIDIFTDYERIRYLAAVKLDGFDDIKSSWIKYLEVHFGYFTRGYSHGKKHGKRNIYVGCGINFSKIFDELEWKRSSLLLKYIQIPFTYVDSGKSFK